MTAATPSVFYSVCADRPAAIRHLAVAVALRRRTAGSFPFRIDAANCAPLAHVVQIEALVRVQIFQRMLRAAPSDRGSSSAHAHIAIRTDARHVDVRTHALRREPPAVARCQLDIHGVHDAPRVAASGDRRRSRGCPSRKLSSGSDKRVAANTRPRSLAYSASCAANAPAFSNRCAGAAELEARIDVGRARACIVWHAAPIRRV